MRRAPAAHLPVIESGPALGVRTGIEKLEWRSADEFPDVGWIESAVERNMNAIEPRRPGRPRRPRAALLLCALLGLLCAPARAIVHTAGDGSGNTTPPVNDPGFGHVGVTGNLLTGIYLGDRWVLTAAHVGEQSITLGGVTYPVIAGSYHQLQHTPSVLADVAMVRLVTTPPLAPLVLASTPPGIGNSVTMIGYGWDREDHQSCWDSSWANTSCTGPLVMYRGYQRLATGIFRVRWGTNLVTVGGMDVPLGGWTTRAFVVRFDPPINQDDTEAQGVPGDSGGAVFNSQGQLVGVMYLISVYQGQDYYNRVAFGTETLCVDVSFYRTQILSIMNQPPQVPALPWPGHVLGALSLAAVARGALSQRRR
jgi:hypothetical protein